jgi:DNA-binding MarR family transcriptional regulator
MRTSGGMKTATHAEQHTDVAFYDGGTYCAEESVGYLMKRIVGSMVQQVDRQLATHGLTNAQWGPLMRLRAAGPCNVAELARWMAVDAGAMTRLLDRLEKKGLCQRVRSNADRRVVQVALSPEGRAAIAGVPAVLADVMNAHLAGFTEAEWQTLKALLQRIVNTGEALRDPQGAASAPDA